MPGQRHGGDSLRGDWLRVVQLVSASGALAAAIVAVASGWRG